VRRFLATALLLIVLPNGLAAQVRPEPGPGDPRLQSVLYDPDQVVQLQIAAGYQLTIELAADEHVENIAVGDAGAWQVTPNKRGDHVFVKALQSGVATNLTIVTDARTYVFDLQPLIGGSADAAFKLRFRYPPKSQNEPVAAVAAPGRYRLSGARALRPVALDDDGHQTRLRWGPDQALPAMFTIDSSGQERPVEGAMRDGIFVIDGVADRLIFRLDRRSASAVRVLHKGTR
jgi:type IV secretion system protein VirB9